MNTITSYESQVGPITDQALLALALPMREFYPHVLAVTQEILDAHGEDYAERGISVLMHQEPELSVFLAVNDSGTTLHLRKMHRPPSGAGDADAQLSALDDLLVRSGYPHPAPVRQAE